MEIVEGIFCINPIIKKYEKRYILGTSSTQLELFVQLLNKRIHIEGFVSEEECGILLFHKPVVSIREIEDGKSLLLITPDSEDIAFDFEVEVCSDIFVLNPQIDKRDITIYGAGKIGKRIESYLRTKEHMAVQRFLDRNVEMRSWTKSEVIVPEAAKLSENSSVILASERFAEMWKNLVPSFKGKCFIPYEFMSSKYWLDFYDKVKFYTIEGDIYNICYHIMHNQGRKLIMYGTGREAQNIAQLYELLDRRLDFFIEDIEMKKPMGLKYEVREVEDILYEESCFVLIAKEDIRSAYRRLESLGLKYAEDFIVAVPFRVDKYFLRPNPLDINLGYTYVTDSQIPGFTVYGEGEYKIAVLGGSTTDAELFPFASWPEIMYNIMRDCNVTMYIGGVAGYESSQELIKLMRDVLPLRVDMVVVFDGFNDARSFSETPFAHSYLKDIFEFAGQHYRNENNLEGEIEQKQVVSCGIEQAVDNVGNWLNNIRMMHAVCEEFDIKFLAFLQPMLASKREMDLEECGLWKMASIFYGKDKKYLPLSFREWGEKHAREYDYIYDFSNLFDGISGVYIDDVHATEKGNEIIAKSIYREILEFIKE